ncbi:glycosyltransferase family A protein [Arcticibacter eurypsychrophilus]|uniref:glycosyltransferase family A protein n=1 Tax=Arcticibacter eurypsychrophilus TaxID=1434752 RepID=UPI00084CEF8C|nr:glycosyltransferase family A protein [Arcticibacter eurypsychrophilus]
MLADALNHIDVVIPSFRMDEQFLLGIFNLKKPMDFEVTYYLVCDHPQVLVPNSIQRLANDGTITLLINSLNLGPSQTRNKGIDCGHGAWILLLDDDIIPGADLLLVYADAIRKNRTSIGFSGVTAFPDPINSITKALLLNGVLGHFYLSRTKENQRWSPTSNIMLNRELLSSRRFRVEWTSAEDVELLVRNSLENDCYYLSLPKAEITHPWWNAGKMQLKRMFNYGYGNAIILKFPHIKMYSYVDFSNTSESSSILLLLSGIAFLLGCNYTIYLKLLVIILLAEYLTNLIRAIIATRKFSLPLAWQMTIHKNTQELGFFYSLIKTGRLLFLFRRIDFGFNKPCPSPFRLNKWKIIKMSLIIGLLLLSSVFY